MIYMWTISAICEAGLSRKGAKNGNILSSCLKFFSHLYQINLQNTEEAESLFLLSVFAALRENYNAVVLLILNPKQYFLCRRYRPSLIIIGPAESNVYRMLVE